MIISNSLKNQVNVLYRSSVIYCNYNDNDINPTVHIQMQTTNTQADSVLQLRTVY